VPDALPKEKLAKKKFAKKKPPGGGFSIHG
jgi:hypothetical protein